MRRKAGGKHQGGKRVAAGEIGIYEIDGRGGRADMDSVTVSRDTASLHEP